MKDKTTMKTTTDYEQQAQAFLDKHGIKFRATLSDTKVAPWSMEEKPFKTDPHHYRITLSKGERDETGYDFNRGEVTGKVIPGQRLTFDFWGSIADAEKLKKAQANLKRCESYDPNVTMRSESIEQYKEEIKRLHPTPYDVLSCISGDVHCPDTFEDFCAEFGYDTDSIKALQTFRRCSAFARRLKAFFTAQEIEELSEIN